MGGAWIDAHYFDERTVRFFESDNAADLARAVTDLAHSPDRRTALADEASDFLKDQYWDTRQNGYLDLVDRLLDGNG